MIGVIEQIRIRYDYHVIFLTYILCLDMMNSRELVEIQTNKIYACSFSQRRRGSQNNLGSWQVAVGEVEIMRADKISGILTISDH